MADRSSQKLVLSHKGLFTNPNQLSEVPDGALTEALNIVLDKAGIAESRRGEEIHNSSFGVPGDGPANSMTFYRGLHVIHYTDSYGVGRLAHDAGIGAGLYTYSGTFTPPTGCKMRFAEAGGSLYFTTNEGIKVIDRPDIQGVPVAAGSLKGLGVVVTTFSTDTPAWFEDDKTVAYRNVFYYYDTSGRKVVGEPSGRAVFSNTGGSATYPNLQPILPSSITSSYRMELYRSMQIDVGTEPSDDMALVWDGPVITSGSWTIADRTPDDSRGPALYTNSSQEGISRANRAPPLAADIALFNGCLFFANTVQPHSLILTLTSVGFVDGLQLGDRIQIGEHVFTAGSGNNLSTKTFRIETSFDTGTNIQRTVETLVYVVNACGQTQIRAQLLGTADEFPGKMLFQEVGVGGPGFSASVSARNSIWHPTLPLTKTITSTNLTRSGSTVTATTSTDHGFVVGDVVQVSVSTTADTNLPTGLKTVTAVPSSSSIQWEEEGSATATSSIAYYVGASTESSANDTAVNRLHWSKKDVHQAVPEAYFTDIGNGAAPILRIVALKDWLFILKTDGVWRVSGDSPENFRVDPFDLTVQLIAPDTVAVANNTLFFLSNQGVVALTDTGTPIISIPIEDQLAPLVAAYPDQVEQLAFATASDSDRKYILWVPTSGSSTYCRKALVWNIFREGWTEWDLPATCAARNPVTDSFYYGDPTSQKFLKERKRLDHTDYSGRSYSRNIAAISGRALTLDSVEGLSVGDLVIQDETTSHIEAIAGLVVTVATEEAFQEGSCSVYTSIPVQVTYAVQTGGNPGIMKHWKTLIAFLANAAISALQIGFETEFSYRQWVTITQLTGGTFGTFPWGQVEWGGSPRPRTLQTWVTREHQRSSQLGVSVKHRAAWERLALSGLSIDFSGGARKVTK